MRDSKQRANKIVCIVGVIYLHLLFLTVNPATVKIVMPRNSLKKSKADFAVRGIYFSNISKGTAFLLRVCLRLTL